jgi:hypothetical protein
MPWGDILKHFVERSCKQFNRESGSIKGFSVVTVETHFDRWVLGHRLQKGSL